MSHKTQSKGVVGTHQMALEMHNTFPKGCFTNVTRRLSHTPALVNQRSASPAFTLPRNERPSVLATAIKEPEIESVEDIENNVDNQSTESLYARFDALLDQTMQEYKLGDRVTGTVASVDDKGAFVDVGGKSPAWIPINEVSSHKLSSVRQALDLNTERTFHVVYRNRNPKPGRHEVVVSLKQIEKELQFKRFQQLLNERITVDGRVTGNNNGGLFVLAEGVTGFCPKSLVPTELKDEGLENLHGKELKFHILEINLDTDRLMLSARGQQMMNNDALQTYKVGDVAVGTVTSVQSYGCFLNIGEGIDGLLHVSQISHEHVSDISKVINVGDKLKVMVLTLDTEKGRLSLSTRMLEPTPGDMVRDPAKVFDRAEEMAEEFKRRVAEVEAEYGEADAQAQAKARAPQPQS